MLAGQTFVGVQTGSLGRSCERRSRSRRRARPDHRPRLRRRARADISGASAHSAGDPDPAAPRARCSASSARSCSRGAIKRQTFGLEPDEIATLLEQREAMLHGIREGAITVDAAGRVTLINDEAKRLLGLDDDVGRQLARDVVPAGSRARRPRGEIEGPTRSCSSATACSSRTGCRSRCADDRSAPSSRCATAPSSTACSRELHDVRNLADALRAQEHEFQHRLHVISGPDRARPLRRRGPGDQPQSSHLHQELAASLVDRRRRPDPRRAAPRQGGGRERARRQAATSTCHRAPGGPRRRRARSSAMLGNLIDNALDSVSSDGAAARRRLAPPRTATLVDRASTTPARASTRRSPTRSSATASRRRSRATAGAARARPRARQPGGAPPARHDRRSRTSTVRASPSLPSAASARRRQERPS